MWTATLAIIASIGPIRAAGLAIDPALPPVLVGTSPTGPLYRFGEDVHPVLSAVVVTMRPGSPPPQGALPLGGPSWLVPVADGHTAVAQALRFRLDLDVASAWPDVWLPQASMYDDPEYGGQWYLEELEMEPLLEISQGSPDIRVAVIDSGIDISHSDLADAVLAPYDAFDDDDDPSPNPGEYCNDGAGICDEHGTAVSGIILARANNGVGIVGLCPTCTLVPIKLLGDGAGSSLSVDVAAFEHALAQDVAVINNSWGFTSAIQVPDTLADAIHRAATESRGGKGALVVFAAGNDNREIRDFEMQALPDVLCVSATDSYGNPTNYTNSGESVDIAAPSATVSIAPEEGITTTFGGTSAAAPVASGVAAWALSISPDLTADELFNLLIDTAIPSPLVTHDEDGHHPVYGYGELSAVGIYASLSGADTGDPISDTGGGADPHDTGTPGDDGGGCGCSSAGAMGGFIPALLAVFALRRRQD